MQMVWLNMLVRRPISSSPLINMLHYRCATRKKGILDYLQALYTLPTDWNHLPKRSLGVAHALLWLKTAETHRNGYLESIIIIITQVHNTRFLNKTTGLHWCTVGQSISFLLLIWLNAFKNFINTRTTSRTRLSWVYVGKGWFLIMKIIGYNRCGSY